MQKVSRDIIHSKIYFFLILCYSFSIPLWKKITPVLIILMFVNWIIELDFKRKYFIFIQQPKIYFFLFFILFYLVHFLGLLNTINLDFARFDLEIKMSFLLFPLLLFSSDMKFIDKKKVNIILLSYVFGCFLSFSVSLINSTIQYFSTDSIMWFFYVYISYFYHSSYISMYIVFALGIIFYLLIEQRVKNNLIKYFLYFLIFCFSAYIIVLSSKAGLISLFLLAILVYFYYLKKHRKYILTSIFFLVYILIVLLGIRSIPSSINRLSPALEAVRAEKKDINMDDGTVQRIEIWKCSLELFKKNLFIGVGTGDVKDELLKKYDEKGMTYAKSFNLNAHNQYLQTMVALGLIGIFCLFATFIASIVYSFKKKNYLYFLFLFIVAFSILVESMFENQAGVLFFTFFNSFLFLKTDELT